MYRICSLLLASCLVLLADRAISAEARVSFELVTEKGFPVTGTQKWLEFFRKSDITAVRIRQSQPGDLPQVENRGTETRPSYHVVGFLTYQNKLLLPHGKSVRLEDRKGLQSWIKTLQDEGIEGFTAVKGAFGLTAEQLVDFHERLAAPLQVSTLGARSGDVARRLVRQASMEFEVTGSARQAFSRNEPALDELQGLSHGTALAAILRPLGLVFAPQSKGRGVIILKIGDSRELPEAWPIGWPTKDSPFKLAPKLFEYLNVEIDDVAVAEAITAIQSRLEMPFLLDHNSILRQQIDLESAPVKFPKRRAFYRKILDTVLFQAKLRSELRVDEAGKPFLWITTTRRG